jgi:dolichyl-phosphate-mannose--protein O-mannosyl transferase
MLSHAEPQRATHHPWPHTLMLLHVVSIAWFRYYINWVPYQLIKRSKFTYHYIPALLLGVQLAAFVTHVVIRWSLLQGKAWQGLGLALGLFVASGAGFWYWGLPYALGFPLTSEEHEARKWLPKW